MSGRHFIIYRIAKTENIIEEELHAKKIDCIISNFLDLMEN
jgi:hypothetical protein